MYPFYCVKAIWTYSLRLIQNIGLGFLNIYLKYILLIMIIEICTDIMRMYLRKVDFNKKWK